ncbi:hypothetical protein [Pseudoxanthomonas sp. Root630]|uniref:hypothetical protein n=1 Tax=Pseudoxanthomonas sp. Root630 TaxID=1736574 RepID=UPI000703680E|nr:hypothetical protein [Pseudoxanthomonas sp. Root630]KRA42465.1 hypothetical protein ASD72_14330 [Pseudoxanthomonas sp. Root630]
MPTDRIVAFLREIGIDVAEGIVPEDSFLPGVRIERGTLVFDRDRLAWPGDLLHEAGHIAVTPPSARASLSDALEAHEEHADGGEAEATAWAYAACMKLGLPAEVLFHRGGYHGRSEALITTFALGVYPGSAGLVRCGMAAMASAPGAVPAGGYPDLLAWLRP